MINMIIVLMALLGNVEQKESNLNQTWILEGTNISGWHSTDKKFDILRFSKDSILELINIENGIIDTFKFELNAQKELVLNSGEIFGKIKSINESQLVIESNVKGNTKVFEKNYIPLTETEITISAPAVLEYIKDHVWSMELRSSRSKSKLVWALSILDSSNEFNMQFTIKSDRDEIVMPAKFNRVEKTLFLSHQISGAFNINDGLDLGLETYKIKKVTDDEILIEFDENKGMGTLILKRQLK